MTKPQAFLLLLTDPSSDCIPGNSSEYSGQIKESESAVRIMTTDARAYLSVLPHPAPANIPFHKERIPQKGILHDRCIWQHGAIHNGGRLGLPH